MGKIRVKSKFQMKPKSPLDRELDEALRDVREGRVYGPFKSVEEMKQSLRLQAAMRPRITT